MQKEAPVPKRTLGQKTEDRLMKFILDEPITGLDPMAIQDF